MGKWNDMYNLNNVRWTIHNTYQIQFYNPFMDIICTVYQKGSQVYFVGPDMDVHLMEDIIKVFDETLEAGKTDVKFTDERIWKWYIAILEDIQKIDLFHNLTTPPDQRRKLCHGIRRYGLCPN